MGNSDTDLRYFFRLFFSFKKNLKFSILVYLVRKSLRLQNCNGNKILVIGEIKDDY